MHKKVKNGKFFNVLLIVQRVEAAWCLLVQCVRCFNLTLNDTSYA